MKPNLTSVVVHYGAVEPTVSVANAAVAYSTRVLVVANDGRTRPPALATAADWIVPTRNLGFGEAANLAISHAVDGLVVLLNNDIILDASTVAACVEEFKDSSVGVVGPVLRHSDGSLQSGAAQLSRVMGLAQARRDPGPAVVDCDWVTGAVLFTRLSVLKDLRMDGSYFLGREDTDFCFRARAAGYRVRCVGTTSAVHHGSQVIGGALWSYYSSRNAAWFADAYFGRGRGALVRLWLAALLGRVLMADLLKRHSFVHSRMAALGIAHSLKPKPSITQGPWRCEPVPQKGHRRGRS